MLFNFHSALDVQSARARLELLIKREAICELREKKAQRSIPQNSYLHLLLAFFAAQTGCTLGYVKEEYFKRTVNADIFLATRHDHILRRDVTVLRSTSALSTDEMSLAIDRFRNWASAEAGIYLPDAHSTAELAAMQVDIERYKPYL